MKRFWESVTVAAGPEGHTILLDGKPMHVPGGPALQVRGAALAEAIRSEWQEAGGGKGGEVGFDDLALTQLAGTAQERIAPDPAPVAGALAKYAASDLLCYRAEGPAPLVERQAREWQPWLDWLAARYGVRLHATEGVMPIEQDETSLARMEAVLRAQTPSALAGLGVAVPALGSVVLGLALAEGKLDAEAAHELASLDERFQVEQWGEDRWAARRRADIGAELAVAARFMALARAA